MRESCALLLFIKTMTFVIYLGAETKVPQPSVHSLFSLLDLFSDRSRV